MGSPILWNLGAFSLGKIPQFSCSHLNLYLSNSELGLLSYLPRKTEELISVCTGLGKIFYEWDAHVPGCAVLAGGIALIFLFK